MSVVCMIMVMSELPSKRHFAELSFKCSKRNIATFWQQSNVAKKQLMKSGSVFFSPTGLNSVLPYKAEV